MLKFRYLYLYWNTEIALSNPNTDITNFDTEICIQNKDICI